MNNPRFICKYKHYDKEYTLEGKTSEFLDADYVINDEKIILSVKPKAYVELLSAEIIFDHEFKQDDKFFANGYQSWTTTREYIKSDKQTGVTPIAVDKLKYLAGISADVWFCDDEKTSGIFRSHCYTYIKNVADNGKIFFMGSLSERQGYTVFRADMNNNTLEIIKDVEGFATDKECQLFNITVLNGDYDDVFDKYFDLMGVKKPKINHMSGYTSWYNYFQKINEKIIIRDLDAMDTVKDSVSIFQIDDGYETFVGDWLDPNPVKFPDGMKYVADKIHDKGYMAGIWIAPFNVQIKSRTYKEHPDWVIKDSTGKPVLGCAGWGGAYTLDMYNPEARAYIKEFFNVILNEWGYDMAKLDFLYSQCQIPRYNKSRGTIMCEAMEFLRECCGDKLILGCGVPLGAAFGYVDACRISCDVDLNYTGKYYNKLKLNAEIPSAQMAINNSIFRRHLNRRVFLCDPDVFFLRYSNLKFSNEQKILLGTINHICGDVLFVSDNMEEYHDEDFNAVKRFFAESDIKIIDANYTSDNKKIILKLRFKNGDIKMMWFTLANGFGNYESIMSISSKR